MATEIQDSELSRAGRGVGSTVKDLIEYGPGFVGETAFNSAMTPVRAADKIAAGVSDFARGFGAGFRREPAPRAAVTPAPRAAVTPAPIAKPASVSPPPAKPPAAPPQQRSAAVKRGIPSRVVRYTGPEHQPDNAPAFSYVDQLRRLQAIDPERYGGETVDRSTFGGIVDDIRRRKAAILARNEAREDRKLSILERQPADAGARAIALERLKAELLAPEQESQAAYRAAQAKLFAAQSTVQEQAIENESRRQQLISLMYGNDKTKAARAKEVYKELYAPREAGGQAISRELQAQKERLALIAAGYPSGEPPADDSAWWRPGYADGGAVSALPATNRGVAPAADRSLLLAQYGQYLAAAAKVGVPPVSFQKYMGLLESTRAAAQGSPAGFAHGGDVEGAIPVAGKTLHGPGTGTSDSIPAVIDGKMPAALSDGEFVIPAAVVKAKGTEFFDKLIAPYLEKTNGVE